MLAPLAGALHHHARRNHRRTMPRHPPLPAGTTERKNRAFLLILISNLEKSAALWYTKLNRPKGDFMRVERLKLNDFRNYEALDWKPRPGLNVIVGENAQGKTNAVEAIFFCAFGR